MSHFNDRVQAWLFNPNKLAPTYPDSAVTRPFPFNAYYPEDEAPEVDKADYALEVGGMVDDKKTWTLDRLYALPQETQITRHICIEGWSAIGKWTGVRFSEFLRRVGADTRAKYVWFRCAEGYSTSIDMATALHPQTQMTLQFDGADPAAQVRLPDEGADADQARLQESQARDGDRRHRQISRRLLGGPGLQLVQRG